MNYSCSVWFLIMHTLPSVTQEAQVIEMCFNDSLNQRWAHYSLPAKSSPPPGFVNKVTVRTKAILTVHILSVTAFVLSSVAQSCLTLGDPVDYSTPGFLVHHQFPEFTQTHVHRVGDAIQPSHPLSSPSPAFSLSQHQGLFRWVTSSHRVAKALEFQLQHQSFQWTFRTDFL